MDPNQVNPVDELRNSIESVKSDYTSILNASSLNTVRDEFSSLDSSVANLSLRVQNIRNRKYAFNKISEQQCTEYQNQWASNKNMIQNQIMNESNRLQSTVRSLEYRVNSLNVGSANPALVQSIKFEVDQLRSQISTSENTLRKLFEGIKTEVTKLTAQFDLVDFTLDNSESASFGFLPSEAVVMAVKAVWTRDNFKEDKEDPKGILFLTDQRLVFEQKEEVATKKVLFVTTERELVQKLQFEVAVVSVGSVKATKQGLFKNEDWIDLTLSSGSFAAEAKLHLEGQDCIEWQKLITRVKTGDINADRAIPVDQAAVEKAKSAPANCPNCGGAITKPVLRGQDSITCDFCGNVIKL
jgi:hypothetical protein